MVTGVARAGRPPASLSWLLVLTELSCITYHVGLPGPAGDAAGVVETGGAQALDASVDQSSASDKPGGYRPDQCWNFRNLTVHQNQVEMIIALDRSASMQKTAFDSTTRLQAAQQVVVASTGAHSGIWFGLEQFPSLKDCYGATCCAGGLYIQPAPNHAIGIQEQLTCGSGDPGCTVASSDSPSHLALQKFRQWYTIEGQGSMSQFVVLITDQDPTCAGDASTDASLCSQAYDEVAKLAKLGVQTFFLSLNSDAQSTNCLASIPTGPSTFAGNSQFVVATDQASLRARLEDIMIAAEANMCRFSVDSLDSAAQVVVSVNHDHVPFVSGGQQAGWRVSDSNPGEIVLSGSYCGEFTSGQGAPALVVQNCSQ
jgi:hypothetical protein